MDTKTPPILQKHYEKPQRKRRERAVEVSLPPLTPPPNPRQRAKTPGTPWAKVPACAEPPRDQRGSRERPYRVLPIGATPLMHACQQADRDRIVSLLREQAETIGYRDRTLRSALHYCMDASAGGAVATVAPELVNAPDAEGHTPLHLAVIAGDAQLVAVLLANGADVNAKDHEGHSILHWATVCGEAECVRLVLASGARPSTPDLRGGSPLHYAAQCCGAAATAELAVPKKVGLRVLQTLLEFGADVNAKDEDGRQPILWAASAGSAEAVLALARAGGSAASGASDKDGLTALHCAASRGHARCIEALVNLCGSQPDHVDDNGCSALHYAATLGHADATALLLKLCADPNRQDRKGRTPALCAAAKGQLETLKILAQHGGSLHARTIRGTGVAHEAVASGRIELVKWLAEKRPSTLDVATHDGRTPLHVAALHGHVDACKVLLDHGARINAVLRTGKGNPMTALDAALHRGHRDCAKLIQMHGGTTAQRLRTRDTAASPDRGADYAAKSRRRRRRRRRTFEPREESGTESEASGERGKRGSRRHRCDHREPELYYEERWIERRTRRRRGSLGKMVGREDSRSYSEEEAAIRLSKGSRRERERRTRSESARYDRRASGLESEVEVRGRGKKKKSSGHGRHDYGESSAERSRSDGAEDGSKEKLNGEVEGDEVFDGRSSLSDDSLEVVVVLDESVERKTEKVVSRRKSKPSGRLEKAGRIETSRAKSKKRKVTETVVPSKRRNSEDEERAEGDSAAEGRSTPYRKDAADDSTSRETVERVTVTAMVHNDQAPDTPELVPKSAKTAEETDQGRRKGRRSSTRPGSSRGPRPGSTSVRSKMDHILERADELQSDLVRKASDLRRERRQEETSPEPDGAAEEGAHPGELSRVQGHASSVATSASAKTEEESDEKRRGRDADSTAEIGNERASEPPRGEHPTKGESKVDSTGTESTSRTAAEDASVSEAEKKSEQLGTELAVDGDKSPKSRGDAPAASEKSDGSTTRTKGKKKKEKRESAREKIDERVEEASQRGEENLSGEKSSMATARITEEGRRMDEKSESRERGATNEADEDERRMSEAPAISRVDGFRFIDDSSTETRKDTGSPQLSRSRPSTARSEKSLLKSAREDRKIRGERARRRRRRRSSGGDSSSSSVTGGSTSTNHLVESSGERSLDRGAIVAVIESPEWVVEDEDDEALDKEIREAIGRDAEREEDTEPDGDDGVGVARVLPSTSEDDETPRIGAGPSRSPAIDSLPQVLPRSRARPSRTRSPPREGDERARPRTRKRRDSGGRDSGIEPSPRISRIPKRSPKCFPNTEKQQGLHMETITRDVQISLRRYHLERKIFFQLMELKRLQIRHGRSNEHVLVKRQVEAFHKAGATGPTLGVARYEQPLTFGHFEAFLYEQLRKLQRRPVTPDWCTEAKQCTRRTHRCHHATSAYTSLPVYTYLGGGVPDPRAGSLLPKIGSRGRGRMTVEVTRGEEKRVIALPAEKLDRGKRYFVTFTVRGETEDGTGKHRTTFDARRTAKSV